MNSNPLLKPPVHSEEVDLFALLQSIWVEKKRVLACTVFAGLLGVIFVLVAPREYQVSSVLRPAAINELDALNRSAVYKLPPEEALAKVGAMLDSYEARLGFFRANAKLFQSFQRSGRSLEQSFEEFNRNSIKLILPGEKKSESLSNYIRLELEYPEGVDGVSILNGFVEYAIAAQRDQIAADLSVIVNNRLNELKGKIGAARSNYESDKESRIASLLEGDNLKRAQLEDELKALRVELKMQRDSRLAELDEAFAIASSMGIKAPTTPSSMASSAQGGSSRLMRTEVNNQNIPLYFMGTAALEAERAALRKRTNDDFTDKRVAEIGKQLQLLATNRQVEVLNKRTNEDLFLRDVDPLRAEVARLRSLNIDMSNLKLVTIDRKAQEPLKPIKPDKLLVIGLSLLAGFLLGVFVVLIRHVLIKQREQTPGHSA